MLPTPKMAGRAIGIISLIGVRQAQLIQAMLLERIGEDTYLRHDIACGDSAMFQGKERDIVLISVVAHGLAQVWRRLQNDCPFWELHDRQKERFEVESLRFRRARPASIDLVDLLHSDVTELMCDPLQRLAGPDHQCGVGVA